MLDKQLLDLIVCPRDRRPLVEADAALVDRVNRAIAAGRARNVLGRAVESPIDGGLVRDDGALLYPIIDGIPVLLADEAIELDRLEPDPSEAPGSAGPADAAGPAGSPD